MRIAVPSRALHHARFLLSQERMLLSCLLVSLLLCWNLSACSPASPSVTSQTVAPTPTCTGQSAVSAPLITRAGLQKMFALPGSPFASVATHSGHWIFVSLQSSTAQDNGIAVLLQEGPSLKLAHIIPLRGTPAGLALTSNEQLLIVADGKGVAVLDAARAEAGPSDALLHLISDGTNPGTVEVALSRDDHYVFATDETGQALSVIDFQQVRTRGVSSHAYVGRVPLDLAPVGLALSPDNHFLYVTTEFSTQNASRLRSRAASQLPGTLTVVDVARAEHDPSHAVVGRVLAGCSPVRVTLSTSGDVAWVTARGSNALLAFKTSLLLKDSAQALVASLAVGPAPVGLALIRQDAEIIVADSNRFAGSRSPQTLTLINVKQALIGHPALLGTIAVGSFPRELALDGQTLLLTNYTSATLSLIDLSKLP
jgi:DNA-binding beta-propeller fold protein YncE